MDTQRVTLQINSSSPGTEVAAETAAALAAASIAIRDSNLRYSESLLETAFSVSEIHHCLLRICIKALPYV